MKTRQPPMLDAEKMNAAREQQVLNARLACLTAVAQVLQGTGAPIERTMSDTDALLKYLIGDIDALKPKSGIVLASSLPPEGVFKPGE